MNILEKTLTWLPEEPRELRLSQKQATIVQILAANPEPMTGYAIAKASNGAIQMTGIYVQLDSLEAKGVITSLFEEVPLGNRRVPKRFVQLRRGTLSPLKKDAHETTTKYFLGTTAGTTATG